VLGLLLCLGSQLPSLVMPPGIVVDLGAEPGVSSGPHERLTVIQTEPLVLSLVLVAFQGGSTDDAGSFWCVKKLRWFAVPHIPTRGHALSTSGGTVDMVPPVWDELGPTARAGTDLLVPLLFVDPSPLQVACRYNSAGGTGEIDVRNPFQDLGNPVPLVTLVETILQDFFCVHTRESLSHELVSKSPTNP
jgi:hypothetical protein